VKNFDCDIDDIFHWASMNVEGKAPTSNFVFESFERLEPIELIIRGVDSIEH
jgi:hypothetical protein